MIEIKPISLRTVSRVYRRAIGNRTLITLHMSGLATLLAHSGGLLARMVSPPVASKTLLSFCLELLTELELAEPDACSCFALTPTHGVETEAPTDVLNDSFCEAVLVLEVASVSLVDMSLADLLD